MLKRPIRYKININRNRTLENTKVKPNNRKKSRNRTLENTKVKPNKNNLENIQKLKPNKSRKIEFDNHTIYIEEKNTHRLEIAEFFVKNRKNPNRDLPVIIKGLMDFARKKGYSTITGNTWIFAEHPAIAERLGVIIPQKDKKIAAFNEYKKKKNIIKILGAKPKTKILPPEISKEVRKNPDFAFKTIDCIIKTDGGYHVRTEICVPYEYIFLPFAIKL